MSVPQKSLFFRPNGSGRTKYREHAPRAVALTEYYLHFGPGGFFGSAIGQTNPARIRVTGKGFASAGSSVVRFYFRYSKDAVRNETNGDISGGTWADLSVDRTVNLADLPQDGADDGDIVNVPMPYFADLEGATTMRLTVEVRTAALTGGTFDAMVDTEPAVVRNAGDDTVARPGYAGQIAFQNMNDGRIT